MAIAGTVFNADSTGNGNGPLFCSLVADITGGFTAGQLATMKLGTIATALDNGSVYVLRNNAGTRGFVIVS